MAQAFLTYENRIKMQRMNFYDESVNVSTQTGDENVDIVYNMKIRLYLHIVGKMISIEDFYRSFNVSTSKSFSINKDIWNEMVKILLQIDIFLIK